ncbi:MAG: 1-deoxy-D-xylulose-5-phosphate synthase [Prevotellaceae bacterium]|jgi:1-deoxy-D-xylulose-5-phosphate synthase|nr:1-deoxy-D-xylulose-5-phosphate synthase [Prevotellaceae bacterium]
MNRVYKYLNSIDTPADLKAIPKEELPVVCDELRQFIIDEVSKNPGHLGSSLGVVELSVALHYVFNTPYDRLVWDVGHQAYGHKILTGRRKEFHSNRQFKGISGFPSPKESEYDAFGVGHASTSISAGLGMSIASLLKNEKNRHIVAVIGDGSMTGGLAFEGLNNASMDKNNLLIILNDNQMAIDPIKGGFTQYLVDITTSEAYNFWRYKIYKLLRRLKLINEHKKNRIIRFTNSIKSKISQQSNNIFEGLNIRYFGPVDGHDVNGLVRILSDIKDFEGPKVLHCITKKGKGYEPAEKSVTEWHAPGVFNAETGERHADNGVKPPLFQQVFGETLLELAKQNEKIVAITPAMPSGCSMIIMQKELPERVFDVGIAEGHAVTFSAGLAKEGMIPFCNVYSSFMQRAYDNVIHDVALQKLNVVLCLDRAGIVGPDGATHQGLFDLAYMRCIPNLTIAAPRNEMELRNLMYTAQQPGMGPFVIRYPRGCGFNINWRNKMETLPTGKGLRLKKGVDLAVLTIGTMAQHAAKAIEEIEQEVENISIAHYDLRFVKPVDEELLHEAGRNFNQIVTVEDGVVQGGFGSAVLEFMSDNRYNVPVQRLGIPDTFVEHGTPAELYAMLGLDAPGLKKSFLKLLKPKLKIVRKVEPV